MKKIKYFLFFLFLFLTDTAYGQGLGLNARKQPGGLKIDGNDPTDLTQRLLRNTITLFFTVGAIGFIIMILWGAVDWILSGGEKEKIATARKRITTAIIGLTLLSLTFVIMVVVGQILGISALQTGDIKIPGLLDR